MDACCISGVIHEGTPTGVTKTIGGVTTYVALPEGDYDKTKAVLYFCDAFGIELINNKLLADSFAKSGFATYAMDMFGGDAVDDVAMRGGKFDIGKWVAAHSWSDARSHIEPVIKVLREEYGIKRFAGTGYCFGGRSVLELTLSGDLNVAVVAHPSLLKLPEDLHRVKEYERTKNVPFLWNTCEEDSQFPKEAQAQADEVFKHSKTYKRNYYAGVKHGFAVRADLSDAVAKSALEGAFEETAKWFKEYL